MTFTSKLNQARGSRARTDDSFPWLAAILCLIVPVLPTISVLPGPLRGNGSPARLLGFLCFGLVVMGFALSRRHTRHWINPGAVILLGYFFLQLLTYGMGLRLSGNSIVEASKTRAVLGLVVMVGISLYTMSTVRTPRQRRIVLGFLVTGLSYACCVALLQSFAGIDLRFLLVPPGFVTNLEASDLSSRQGAIRAIGTSDHAIEFSVLAAAAVPLSFHLARYASKPLARQLAAIACAVAFVAVPSAVSRSGVVALIAALSIYAFALNVRILGNVAILGIVTLLGYKIVFPSSINALWSTILGSQDDASVQGRTDDYAAVSEQFHRDPWFGLGLGGYPPDIYRILDNQWLQAIVQGGVVGLLALALMAVGGVTGMTAGLRRAPSPRDRDQVFAISAAFVGVLVSTLTFDLFAFQQATYLFFILFGLLWSIQGGGTEAVDTASKQLSKDDSSGGNGLSPIC